MLAQVSLLAEGQVDAVVTAVGRLPLEAQSTFNGRERTLAVLGQIQEAVRRAGEQLEVLNKHEHEWDEFDDYCRICGAERGDT
jgi:hypothetical protein